MDQVRERVLVVLGFAFTGVITLALLVVSVMYTGGILSDLGSDNMSVSELSGTVERLRMLLIVLGAVAVAASVIMGVAMPMIIRRGIDNSIHVISRGLDGVYNAGENIMEATLPLANRTSEQASAIEEVSSSMEEISSMTKQTSDNADMARRLAEETSSVAMSCSSSMEEMSIAIGQVQEVGEKTKGIVKGIDEISFQTNLLALNAAVEAARAGEAGKGFAVVAEEVRNLAKRAADSARNTSEMIDNSTSKITDAMNKVFEVIDQFSKVVESMDKVTGLIREISSASSEQSTGISEISNAMVHMDKLTQQNAEGFDLSVKAVEELQELLAVLNESFQGYGNSIERNNSYINEAVSHSQHNEARIHGRQDGKQISAGNTAMLPARKDKYLDF